MNNVNYLLLSSKIDYSTDLICAELENRGTSYLRINRDCFEKYEVVYDLQAGVMSLKMCGSWYFISAESIRAVYFRAPVFLRSSGKPYTVQEQLARSQWSSFIRNLIVFDSARWINHPVATYQAENKLFQLKIAQRCGLSVPKTYVSNALPEEFAPENMYVVKSLDTALFHDGHNEMFTYSTVVEGKELLNAEISSAPIILQEYLAEKTDFRVTVVNDRIYPVAITKHGKSIEGDWRKSNKDDLDYTPAALPQFVEEKLLSLMHTLHLSFGGIDLAKVNDTYYFIEVNPTGEWGWLTSNAKLSIDKAIVDCMMN